MERFFGLGLGFLFGLPGIFLLIGMVTLCVAYENNERSDDHRSDMVRMGVAMGIAGFPLVLWFLEKVPDAGDRLVSVLLVFFGAFFLGVTAHKFKRFFVVPVALVVVAFVSMSVGVHHQKLSGAKSVPAQKTANIAK